MANKPSPLDTSSLTMTFDEEFNTFTSSPTGSVSGASNGAGWMTQYPFWGASRTLALNHEAEYYSDPSVGVNPFSLNNGVLGITASVAAPGSNSLNLPYNSGVITTYKSFAQLYGYFEVRAQLPTGQGLWPAFWMLPVNGQSTTELDIFEMLGNSATTMHSTTHSSVAGAGVSQAFQVANTSTGFHTYGVDWQPATITFYMDGQAVASTATPADMNVPMYMLLNLAVGGAGSWPGATNSATPFPATMQIDYVHAYATAATIGMTDPSPQVPPVVLPAVEAQAAAGKSWVGVVVLHYGNQDPGSRQPGVGVALLNASGQVVATAVTDANGAVQFLNLAPGTYQMRYIPPANLVLQPGSQADVATGLTAKFNLGYNQGLSLIHETVLSSAHMHGSVVLAGAPQAGVTVSLLNTSKAVVATTTTDSNGGFDFYTAAGTYTVKYSPPAGEAVLIGSHADTLTATSAPIALVAGQSFLLSPEALVADPASLSGSVLLASGATAGQAGVGVTLLSGSGAVVATATTDSRGAFSFTNLAAGTYQLRYAPVANTLLAQGSAADPATGLTATFTVAPRQTLSLPTETLLPAPASISGSVLFGSAGDAGVGVSLLSGGQVVASTTTDARGAFSFGGLAAGAYQVRYAAPANEVLAAGPAAIGTGLTGTLTVTAGQALTLGAEAMGGTLGSITGSTMLGSAPLAGATVRLLDSTGVTTLASTTTNASGAYHLTGIATGYYRVGFATPAGDFIQGGPADVATGKTMAFGVTAGGIRTTGPVVFAAATDSVGGSVVLDGAGAAGAAVALVDTLGATVATAATDAAGRFGFSNVTPGTYQVKYAALPDTVLGAASAANPVNGFSAPFTLANNQTLTLATETLTRLAPPPAAAPAATPAAKPVVAPVVAPVVTPAVTPIVAPVVAVVAAKSVSAASPTPPAPLPQAPVLPASLKGTVSYAAPGVATPAPEAGVVVSLLRADGSVAATMRTIADGKWGFSTVAPGTYQVRYTAPDWQVAVSGPAKAGTTDPITLVSGQSLTVADERFTTPPASIGGSIVHYGQGDAGTGQAGVAVTLLDATGKAVASASSIADGSFSFTNVSPGTYQVRYTAPDWETFQARPANAGPGLSAPIKIVAGQQVGLTHETLLSSSNSFAITATGKALRGDGNYTVTGGASNSTLKLGNGNQTVSLTGGGETVTVGTGSSTISVGAGSTVHAGGGLINTTTVTASGGGNTFDVGSGMVFLRADGSPANVFMLNAKGQGLTTITGFNPNTTDVLNLSRTLAGLNITSPEAIGIDVTATTANGNTTLWVDPTGGHAAPSAFAVLNGVTTTVGQLVAGHHIALN